MLIDLLWHLEYRNTCLTMIIHKPNALVIVTITFEYLVTLDTNFIPTLEMKTAQYTSGKY